MSREIKVNRYNRSPGTTKSPLIKYNGSKLLRRYIFIFKTAKEAVT